jgi:hypothetical protein
MHHTFRVGVLCAEDWCILLSKLGRSIPFCDHGDKQPAQYDCCGLFLKYVFHSFL